MASVTHFSSRQALILAKLESTEGTDAAPVVGTDELPCMGQITIANGIQHGRVVLDDPFGGEFAAPTVVGAPTATLRCPIYGKGKSTSIIVPPTWWDVLMQSCGDIDNSLGGVAGEIAKWTPSLAIPQFTDNASVVTAQDPSFTLYFYVGLLNGTVAAGTKRLIKMLGCRVQRVRFVLNPQNTDPVVAEFTIVGKYVAPADVTTDLSGANNDGLVNDYVTANLANTTIGAQATKMAAMELTFDFASEHVAADCDEFGVGSTALRDWTVSGTVNPLMVAEGTFDFQDAIENATTQALDMATNGIFPASRTGGDGYGIKFEGNFTYTGDLDRGGPLVRYALTLKGVKTGIGAGFPSIQLL